MKSDKTINLLGIDGSYHEKSQHFILYEMIEKISQSFCECSTTVLSMCNIEFCHGCKKCFRNENCPIDDDINKIKHLLNDTDIMLFYSSIYADFINGYTKNMLDRLSYMTHLMPYIGKYCVIIISTYRSGVNDSIRYLYRFFSLLGFNVIGIVSITTEDDRESINTKLSQIYRRIERELYGDLHNMSLIQRQMCKKLRLVYGSTINGKAALED